MRIKKIDTNLGFTKPIFVVTRGCERYAAGGLRRTNPNQEPGFNTILTIFSYTGLVIHFAENKYLKDVGTKFYYAGMAFRTTSSTEAEREF